jgi:GT2 family glycosyltransferase
MGDKLPLPGISVIILTKDKPELILPLLDSLLVEKNAFESVGLNFEIIVGDTGSTDKKVIQKYNEVAEIVNVVFGFKYHFSCNNNSLANFATCATLLFLNNDVVLPYGQHSILHLYKYFDSHNDIGVLGAVLHFPDYSIQHIGVRILRRGINRGLPFHPLSQFKIPLFFIPQSFCVPAVTGACLLIGRNAFYDAGGFNESYEKELQDVALCLCVSATGKKIKVVNIGRLLHLENGTREKGESCSSDRNLFRQQFPCPNSQWHSSVTDIFSEYGVLLFALRLIFGGFSDRR